MRIDVYSAPDCQQCRATKMMLEREGLEYNEIDVTKDDEAQKHCTAMGYATLPVVVAGERNWSGFRYDLIKSLKAQQ